jgi:acetyltransferase-like isoleucine patch superfamily enzyme
MEYARLGNDCNVGEHCFIENGAQAGDRCVIKNGVALWDGVTLEDDVFIGPYVVFTNDLWPRAKKPFAVVKTRVKHGATIGANSTILCGITIGESAFIAAGTLVTKDVPSYALIMGSPGRVRGYVCHCGLKLRLDRQRMAKCTCGKVYRKKNGTVCSQG